MPLCQTLDFKRTYEPYREMRVHFGEQELSTLIFRIMIINAWNRANVGIRGTLGALDKAVALDRAGLA